MRIATSANSWGNRRWHVMASPIHEHQHGHAECQLIRAVKVFSVMVNYLTSESGTGFCRTYPPCVCANMALDDSNFFFRQSVQSMDDEVDEALGGSNLGLRGKEHPSPYSHSCLVPL
jgi:hypothetical protein